MAIDTTKLTKEEIGCFVQYNDITITEIGKITAYNQWWVWVVYKCNGNWDYYYQYTSVATNPDKLTLMPVRWKP